MSVLVDTNILMRSIEPQHPMQRVAADALSHLRRQGEQLVLLPQNRYEFWAAATRPVAQNGLGLTPAEAEPEIARFKTLFPVMGDSAAIFPVWEQLVVQHQVFGKNAHDARLVAAMLVHGVASLLTFNKPGFVRYGSIVVISPQDVVSPPAAP